MKHLSIISLVFSLGISASAGPTCAEYFEHKAKGTDWPYALPMSDFARQCEQALLPGYCSQVSKNPNCWEENISNKTSRQKSCLPKSSCETIASVNQNRLGQYFCKATNGLEFSCDKIVEELGTNVEGVIVNVTVPFIDWCHVLGACGDRTCTPTGHGEAHLDPACY